MVITASPTVEAGVTAYLGVVSGDAIMGANAFKDRCQLRDIVGGRSSAYEAELKRAKALARRDRGRG